LLTNITAKRRKSWLLAASALASSLGVSEPALADECGALDASGSVTCTNQFNPYPAGITYFRIQPGDLTVNLEKDVTVSLQTAGTAVFVTNNFSGNAIVQDLGATITATVPAPAGVGNEGIHALSLTGSAIVMSSGKITLGNSDGENAIGAFAGGGTASVTYTGPGLISHGNESQGIQAFNFGNGTAIIEASGNVEVSGPSASVIGLVAHAGGDNDASVTYHSGTINVSGGPARGILAWVDGNGSPTATTDAGTFINVNGAGPGVYVFSGTATEANGQKLIANVASTITGVGTGALGIKAFSGADAPIFVTYTGPGIATAGANGHGIAGLSGSGSVNVTSTGPITTNGSGAFGILADSGTIASRTTFNGAPGGEPIVVTPSVGGAPGGSIVVTTSGQGSITTQGVESHGIWATSTTGTVQVSTINVSTTGEFSAGINAAGGGGTTVNVASGGSVMGGWQPDVTSVGPTYGLPAAGVILGSSVGTATLTNNGSIGALSDRAVANSPLFPSNNTSIINNGLITGFVQFTGDNNSVLNNGTFNLRHFADTTGSGSDTLRVAIADIGTGTSNSFTNVGMLALLGASGATKLDATGQYIPLGNVNNEMALGGPLQGHLIGVTTFTNSGTIDLQSNPVAGDVLVITSARQAGVAGLGTFVSNGGLLKLDTVLNEGGPATRSDTLVVDGTSVGANGATNMLISNAGGAGALTVGDGILVVQVLNPNRSAAGVFSLGGPVEAGAFSYLLFRGGVDPGASGNWYLRSTLTCSLTPTLPQCRPPVTGGGGEGGETPTPGPVIPNFRPAVPLYTALSPLAAQYGFSALGTLHERTGDPYAMVDPGGGARAAHAVYLKAVPAAAPSITVAFLL
jgi:Autochaperone Domain Type 1